MVRARPVSVSFQHMQWQDLVCALDVAKIIPPEDLAAILAKPDTRERDKDSAWRRLCAKYDVSTGALCKSAQGARLVRKVAKVDGLVAEVEKQKQELADCKRDLALLRVQTRQQ